VPAAVREQRELANWFPLSQFQLDVAEHWIKLGRETEHPALRFVCFFTAFNAMYWLWSRVTNIEYERPQINDLIERIHERQSTALDGPEVDEVIAYFRDRDPIRNMDQRWERDSEGSDYSAIRNHRDLRGGKLVRLKALAMCLYQVRCNLVHGSKKLSGVDAEILEHASPAMERLALAAAAMSGEAMH
jgi:hypothetical protein